MLGDFGAAGLVDAHTVTGSVALSIAYAAPEMLQHGEMSPGNRSVCIGARPSTTWSRVDSRSVSRQMGLADTAGIASLLSLVTTEPS